MAPISVLWFDKHIFHASLCEGGGFACKTGGRAPGSAGRQSLPQAEPVAAATAQLHPSFCEPFAKTRWQFIMHGLLLI